jgi:kinesin family protein 6/9
VPKSEDKGIINNQKESWNFKFDKILHNVSQEEVFEYCAREIIQKAIEGFNGTVFAYGQTGSGKTFTMSGSPNIYNYRGIISRAINKVFIEIGGKPEYEFHIKISYLEIYNEQVRIDIIYLVIGFTFTYTHT